MDNRYNELYERLLQLQWLLQHNTMQNQMERGPFADTTRGQGRVLAMLKIQPVIATRDLAYLLGIRPQSLNELLGKLEKAEYITRTQSEEDKRVVLVSLTDKGRSETVEESDYSDIFGCLTPEEQDAFADYLDRVIAALEKKLGIDEEDISAWVEEFRSRLDHDSLAHLMSLRGSLPPHMRRGFPDPDGWGAGLDPRTGFPPAPGPRPGGFPGRGPAGPGFAGFAPDPSTPRGPFPTGMPDDGRFGPFPDEVDWFGNSTVL